MYLDSGGHILPALAHPSHGRLHNARVHARACAYMDARMCVARLICMTYVGVEPRRGTCMRYMSILIEHSRRAGKKRLAYAVAGTKRGDRCRHFFFFFLQNYRCSRSF